MVEIFWNKKLKEYTLEEETCGVKSIKRVPLKFKLEDKTAKYRKEELRKDL